MITAQELIDFEEDICKSFQNKEIRSPVHLYSNCENQLIDIFKNYITPMDYVFCTWRSHYQCLLHGVPKEQVKQAILDNRSISLCFPEHKVFSSAIVGGNIPIALGVALGVKRNGGSEHVFLFIGDMTSQCGIFMEALEYTVNFKLPIMFIVEDNNKSVCTPTRKTWGTSTLLWERLREDPRYRGHLTGYYYESKYPHAGTGERIQF